MQESAEVHAGEMHITGMLLVPLHVLGLPNHTNVAIASRQQMWAVAQLAEVAKLRKGSKLLHLQLVPT